MPLYDRMTCGRFIKFTLFICKIRKHKINNNNNKNTCSQSISSGKTKPPINTFKTDILYFSRTADFF